MRLTFTDLQNVTKSYISQSSGSFAGETAAVFIKRSLNNYYHSIQRKLQNYINEDLALTTDTVADQARYHYPPNIMPPIEAATLEIGGVKYDLEIVDSRKNWNYLNEIDFSGTTIPQYIFPMRDHFELYPIPQEDGDEITLYASLIDRDMTQEDYTTGTVGVTNNDETVTGAGTTFTKYMAGRWFQTTTDSFWYRINTFTDTTHFELETSFQGLTDTGQTYTIGESPEIPVELHELLPHGAAADFYSGPRKDADEASRHMNYFYTGDYNNFTRDPKNVTGGLLEAEKRYSRRGIGKIINRGTKQFNRFDERWSSSLSSTI